MNTQFDSKPVIGRLERVGFPDWNISGLEAKVDTGAYTSSIHCNKVEADNPAPGVPVKFYLLDPEHPEFEKKQFSAVIEKIKPIRSSNGMIEERIIIKTRIRISDDIYQIELSLSDRSEMKYPVLLGRKFIRNRFVVDVSKKFLNS